MLANTVKMKDEFLAIMSHEFKTPITVINTAIQTINRLYCNQISQNVKKHLNTIDRNSLRLLKLVNNLIDLTRYKNDYIQVISQTLDLVLFTREAIMCIRPLAEQKGVNIEFSSNTESKILSIDEEKYERILLNLLSNAIKYTLSGKSIYVQISLEENFVVITVRDEGIGIPKEKLDYVLERFVQLEPSLTRRFEGMGIGLCLVKMMIAALKGTVMFESEVGLGSTFTVTLPIIKPKKDVIDKKDGELHNSIPRSVAIECSDIFI